MKRTSRKEEEASLRKQLKDKGADVAFFEDLVSDYMDLWDTKNELTKDIKARGVNYDDVSSVGVMMKKSNPSIKERFMVHRQMVMILDKLGLKADKCKAPSDDDDYDDL